MSEVEKVRDGLKERGIAFTVPMGGLKNHTWLHCIGCDISLIQHDDGTTDFICYNMTAEQVLAFVDMMESK